MSILIKGMKMPKDCEACDLCYDYVECMASSYNIKINVETRPKECPLIDVPSPHGRLIYAEKLSDDLLIEKTKLAELAYISKDFKNMAMAFGLNEARILTRLQKTIIESEGEKEDV